MRMFSDYCNFGLYKLKLCSPNHIVEDLCPFGTMFVFDERPFEHYNVKIKHVYRQTSRIRNTFMNETKRMVGCRMTWTQIE